MPLDIMGIQLRAPESSLNSLQYGIEGFKGALNSTYIIPGGMSLMDDQ